MSDLMSGTVPVGGPFTLTDHDGNTRRLSDFRGKVVLLYFGFTYCPDVCPTDLLVISEVMQRLGADALRVQPIFITLDPERDTPGMLRSYVTSFHPSFVALTGTQARVRAVATAYKVFFEKVQPAGTPTYFIDHMSFTFLIDAQGRYVGALPRGTPPERMAPVVRDALTASRPAE
ncbi:MAG: SCO family protein, partial [Pseudomonadota bacterium]